jgi:uncharacterized SAM-binding protein YcdF (DUF218 family)
MLMLLRLKTLLKAIVFPPAGPLLLAILGVFLIKRRPRLARACLILAVASLWLLSSPWMSDALTGLVERYPPLDLRTAGAAQAIVILGGGGQRAFAPEYAGPAADPLLLERLSFGAYIARKTGLPILVTGYHIEAAAMRDSLQRNFDINVRWVDDQSYDTFENARNSVRLLNTGDIHRVFLVTHATHMWRSVHEFTAAGIEVVPAPVGILAEREVGYFRVLPSAGALLRSSAAINELVGEPMRNLLAALHLRRQTPAG